MKKIKIDTKTKITNSAKKLFNEQETLSVTTNHIAKEAGISPGNLYYHFKNKEEIILYLYKNLSNRFESLNSFESLLMSKNPIQTLHENFENYGEMFYEYRFLLRDSMVLMALYPSFKQAFSINQDKRIIQIEKLLEFLIKEDILKYQADQSLKKEQSYIGLSLPIGKCLPHLQEKFQKNL